MSIVAAAVLALAVLSGAGLLPVLSLVGCRWIALPLPPLAGSVVAAGAATGALILGGPFMVWFVALSVAAGAGATWRLAGRWTARRPRHTPTGAAPVDRSGARRVDGRSRVAGMVGVVAVVAATVWSMRGLATPTVGFDARSVWLLRSGWFLQPHHQLLVDMRIPDLLLFQTAYPPLVSASSAVAWAVTGDHSVRLAVVVVALLNAAALAAAALALVECGRRGASRLTAPAGHHAVLDGQARRTTPTPLGPLVVGVAGAFLAVVVAAGITEPFLTNGYADPIWSLAALGAVAYGLQLPAGKGEQGAAAVLVLVAGMSKDEGVVTAAALVGLIAVRATLACRANGRRAWRRPAIVAAAELAAIAAWPVAVRLVHARDQSTAGSALATWPNRAVATVQGMSPYLHVAVLAAPLAVVAGVLLRRVRRAGGFGHDGWAWAALLWGLVAVGGALVVGTGAIKPWVTTTVHRVTEFSALCGWWIVATWAVAASGAPAAERRAVAASHPVGAEAARVGAR